MQEKLARDRFGWMEWPLILVAIVGLFVLVENRFHLVWRPRCCNSPRLVCNNNLRQIDGAVQQWALEFKKQSTDSPELAGSIIYLKGTVLPLCPSGGVYKLGKTVADPPTCSIPGHSL